MMVHHRQSTLNTMVQLRDESPLIHGHSEEKISFDPYYFQTSINGKVSLRETESRNKTPIPIVIHGGGEHSGSSSESSVRRRPRPPPRRKNRKEQLPAIKKPEPSIQVQAKKEPMKKQQQVQPIPSSQQEQRTPSKKRDGSSSRRRRRRQQSQEPLIFPPPFPHPDVNLPTRKSSKKSLTPAQALYPKKPSKEQTMKAQIQLAQKFLQECLKENDDLMQDISVLINVHERMETTNRQLAKENGRLHKQCQKEHQRRRQREEEVNILQKQFRQLVRATEVMNQVNMEEHIHPSENKFNHDVEQQNHLLQEQMMEQYRAEIQVLEAKLGQAEEKLRNQQETPEIIRKIEVEERRNTMLCPSCRQQRRQRSRHRSMETSESEDPSTSNISRQSLSDMSRLSSALAACRADDEINYLPSLSAQETSASEASVMSKKRLGSRGKVGANGTVSTSSVTTKSASTAHTPKKCTTISDFERRSSVDTARVLNVSRSSVSQLDSRVLPVRRKKHDNMENHQFERETQQEAAQQSGEDCPKGQLDFQQTVRQRRSASSPNVRIERRLNHSIRRSSNSSVRRASHNVVYGLGLPTYEEVKDVLERRLHGSLHRDRRERKKLADLLKDYTSDAVMCQTKSSAVPNPALEEQLNEEHKQMMVNSDANLTDAGYGDYDDESDTSEDDDDDQDEDDVQDEKDDDATFDRNSFYNGSTLTSTGSWRKKSRLHSHKIDHLPYRLTMSNTSPLTGSANHMEDSLKAIRKSRTRRNRGHVVRIPHNRRESKSVSTHKSCSSRTHREQEEPHSRGQKHSDRNAKKDRRKSSDKLDDKSTMQDSHVETCEWIEEPESVDTFVRMEMLERFHKSERLDKSVKTDKSKRTDKSNQIHKAEKVKKSDMVEKKVKKERVDKSERIGKKERVHRSERVGKAERLEKKESVDTGEIMKKSERVDKAERLEKKERLGASDKIKKSHSSKKHRQISKDDQSSLTRRHSSKTSAFSHESGRVSAITNHDISSDPHDDLKYSPRSDNRSKVSKSTIGAEDSVFWPITPSISEESTSAPSGMSKNIDRKSKSEPLRRVVQEKSIPSDVHSALRIRLKSDSDLTLGSGNKSSKSLVSWHPDLTDQDDSHTSSHFNYSNSTGAASEERRMSLYISTREDIEHRRKFRRAMSTPEVDFNDHQDDEKKDGKKEVVIVETRVKEDRSALALQHRRALRARAMQGKLTAKPPIVPGGGFQERIRSKIAASSRTLR